MKRIMIICFAVMLAVAGVRAQVPQTMSYQGVLKDSGGVIVPDDDYSFEFIPGELFEPGSGSIIIALTGACWDMNNGSFCEGESWVYFDDFRIERMEPVPSEASSWGKIKAIYR